MGEKGLNIVSAYAIFRASDCYSELPVGMARADFAS